MVKSSPSQISGFFKKYAAPKSTPKKEIYYEDLYGSPNEDELFDRFPDTCESESDSTGEKSKRISKSADRKRVSSGRYTGNSAQFEKRAGKTVDEQNSRTSEKRYKIAPNKNSSRSIEIPPKPGKAMFEAMTVDADAEVREALESSPSVSAQIRHTSLVKRVPRPVSRRLFKQELGELDREKKSQLAGLGRESLREKAAARRKVKSAMRRINLPKKPARLPGDQGTDEAEPEVSTGFVLVDLTNVNVEEYEILSDAR